MKKKEKKVVFTVPEIAAMTGKVPAAVRYWIRTLGLKTCGRFPVTVSREELVRFLEERAKAPERRGGRREGAGRPKKKAANACACGGDHGKKN